MKLNEINSPNDINTAVDLLIDDFNSGDWEDVDQWIQSIDASGIPSALHSFSDDVINQAIPLAISKLVQQFSV